VFWYQSVSYVSVDFHMFMVARCLVGRDIVKVRCQYIFILTSYEINFGGVGKTIQGVKTS